MPRRSLPLVCVVLLALALTPGRAIHAQSPIKVSVNEVIVPITVTDDKGRFVSNLAKSDFHIFDEGKEQTIDFFSHEQSQPIVIGFLIDTSNGMKIHWDKYKEAATELMLNLLPGEKKYSGYLITYGNEPELVADTSSDSEKMVDKMRKIKPAGGSALFDAIYMACTSRKTVRGEPYEPRRVLIVIGDGHDTASKKTLEEVTEIAQRNLVTIYGMSSTAFGMRSEGEENLVALTAQTGGKVETPLNNIYKDVSGYLDTPSDDGNYALAVGTGGYTAEISGAIFRSVASLSGEITTQYVIRYHPDIGAASESKQFRRIKVGVNLPGVQVRYRNGYYPYAVPQ
ncbi:MAG TPA: VWA domain-containing protein [Bryobacteraceae bacterium]|jgi:VWFA-related protein|nr:VWA domain-containing protein [Bryobacteraceae bacterium]